MKLASTSVEASLEDRDLPFYVAMGASGAEGLRDIKDLLAAFPQGMGAIIMAVLHRPVRRLSRLREVLERVSNMPIVIAETGDRFRPGVCYIGRPDAHLQLATQSRVRLVEGAHDQYRNRTVDLLFGSIALHAKKRAIGIVLSGSLDDGSRGLAAIHHAGGRTLVLATHLASHDMPRNAIQYDGPIDRVGSIQEIAVDIALQLKAPTGS